MHIEILGRTRKDVGVLAIGIYGTSYDPPVKSKLQIFVFCLISET